MTIDVHNFANVKNMKQLVNYKKNHVNFLEKHVSKLHLTKYIKLDYWCKWPKLLNIIEKNRKKKRQS